MVLLQKVEKDTAKLTVLLAFLQVGDILMPANEWFPVRVFYGLIPFWVFGGGAVKRRKIIPFEGVASGFISCEELENVSKG